MIRFIRYFERAVLFPYQGNVQPAYAAVVRGKYFARVADGRFMDDRVRAVPYGKIQTRHGKFPANRSHALRCGSSRLFGHTERKSELQSARDIISRGGRERDLKRTREHVRVVRQSVRGYGQFAHPFFGERAALCKIRLRRGAVFEFVREKKFRVLVGYHVFAFGVFFHRRHIEVCLFAFDRNRIDSHRKTAPVRRIRRERGDPVGIFAVRFVIEKHIAAADGRVRPLYDLGREAKIEMQPRFRDLVFKNVICARKPIPAQFQRTWICHRLIGCGVVNDERARRFAADLIHRDGGIYE